MSRERERLAGICAFAGALLTAAIVTVAPLQAQDPPAAGPADTMTEATVELFGRVVKSTQPESPVVGAMVSVVELGRGRLTDGAGRFRLEQLPPGTYTLRIQHLGYATLERRILLPGQADIVYSLDPTPVPLQEVVATASIFASPVIYQPVQAFSTEALQRRSATSLGDLLDGEPGIAMSSFGNVTGRPVIRGLSYERVLVLENGERMGDLQETGVDHAVTMDPLGAARIEVVRGPASVLYGSQALGGVVNVLSEDIPRVWRPGLSGGFAAQAASMNDLGAGFGRAVYGGEHWAMAARGSFRESGEIRTPEGRLPFTQSRAFTGGLGAAYNTERFDGGVSFGMLDLVYGIPPAVDEEDDLVEIRTERRTAQARAHWRLPGFVHDVELRLNASRYWQEEWAVEETEPGVFEEDEAVLGFLKPTFSSTLTLRHSPFGPFDRGAFGFHFFFEAMEAWGEEALTPDANRPQFGIFAFQDLPLSDRLRLQFGARLDADRVGTKANERFPDASDKRSAVTASGSVGANLRARPDLELGLQFSRAHRSPMLEELYVHGAHIGASAYEIGNPNLSDEIGHGADFILRGTRDRLAFEAAAYYNNISDYIIFQPTDQVDPTWGLPIVVYEPDGAVLKGGEVAVDAELAGSLALRVTGDYVHAERADGTALPFTPPARALFGLTHEASWGWLGGNVRMAAAQKRVAPDEDPTAGYTLFGLEAGYRMAAAGGHIVSFRVDNVLDRAYKDHLTRIEDRNRPMPGRNVNLSYRWIF